MDESRLLIAQAAGLVTAAASTFHLFMMMKRRGYGVQDLAPLLESVQSHTSAMRAKAAEIRANTAGWATVEMQPDLSGPAMADGQLVAASLLPPGLNQSHEIRVHGDAITAPRAVAEAGSGSAE
jgi:hypothetical protein